MRKSKNPYLGKQDEKLMQLVSYGDTTAFEELYDRYKKRLLYYFYRMLGNDEQKAQDFLQDIFLKVIEKPEYFNPDRKFSTWIFSIAHNMCKNEYRRMEVRKNISNEEPSENDYSAFNEPDIDMKDFTLKLYEELDILGQEHKTTFVLRYKEDFKIKEIAVIMECSEGTVKSRLFYTCKKLSEKLKCYKYEF